MKKVKKKRKKKNFLTVEEAASIMDCHASSVYRLLAEGWLNGPVGRPDTAERASKGASALISQKSLFQLMVFDSIKNTNGRRPNDFKQWRKNFKKFFSQTVKANRSKESEEKDKKTDPFAEIKAKFK
jgi:hypothetical protein